jgi:hypothetical protein
MSPCTSIHGNASARKISRPGFATVGSSKVPTFSTMVPGCIADSSAIDEPHSGQKCLRIGFPLPPMLLNVFSAPSIHRLLVHPNQRGEDASSEFLAISAVAHRCVRRVAIGRVTHRAAQTAAVDLHRHTFLFSSFGSTPNAIAIHHVCAMAKRDLYTGSG